MEEVGTLACLLIREAFGELPHAAAKALFTRGRLSLQQLIGDTNLKLQQVQTALLTLQLHNCLTLEVNPKGVEYELNAGNVLTRLRFPRFLAHARVIFHEEGEVLTEEILLHGRLNKNDIITQAAQRLARMLPNTAPDKTSLKVKEAFLKMIRSGYIVRIGMTGHGVESAGGLAAGNGADDEDKGKKRKASATKKSPKKEKETKEATPARKDKKGEGSSKKDPKKEKKDGSEKKRKTKAKEKSLGAAPPELLMLSARAGNTSSAATATSAPAAANKDEVMTDKPHTKSKKESSEPQFDVAAAFEEVSADILWRINYTRFNMAFRREACALVVAEKLGISAGHIMRAIHTLTDSLNETKIEEFSSPVAAAALIEQVHQEDPSLSKDQIELYLELMCTDKHQLIRKLTTSQDDRSFIINTANIVQLLQQKIAETAVSDKFGGNGLRVFRLLITKHQLEQRQVSDMAMLPMKDAREVLFELLGAEFLHLQEVSKAADHAPYHTYYLFTVNLTQVYKKLSDAMTKTMKNLKCREQFELSQVEELLKRAEEDRERSEGAEPSAELKKEIERISNMEDRVAHALSELDYTYMVLNDW